MGVDTHPRLALTQKHLVAKVDVRDFVVNRSENGKSNCPALAMWQISGLVDKTLADV